MNYIPLTTFPSDTEDVEQLLKLSMAVLLTLRANCSRITSKSAHLSPYLPYAEESIDNKDEVQ